MRTDRISNWPAWEVAQANTLAELPRWPGQAHRKYLRGESGRLDID